MEAETVPLEELKKVSWTFGDPSTVSYFERDENERHPRIVRYGRNRLAAMRLEPSPRGLLVRAPLGFVPPAEVRGDTALDFFQAVADAVAVPLDPNDEELRPSVEERIGMFFRQEPVRAKYEEGTLTTLDLMGDHKFFEGFSIEDGVVRFSTGS